MESPLSKPECKNMDACLRRLKQELVSMKEAGDGLHTQMNSMMGALQELKLLQVQTALENLNVSGRPINRGLPRPAPPASPEAPATASPTAGDHHRTCFSQMIPDEPGLSPFPSTRSSLKSGNSCSLDDRSPSQNRSSLGHSSSSASSLDSENETNERSMRSLPSMHELESIPKRWSGYAAPQVDFYGPTVGNPLPEPYPAPQDLHHAQLVDLPGILYNLSREGPSLDSDYSKDSTDNDSDWTSSLMSGGRNRQPLVLGDNVFADLVGNWLDLPEVEREEEEEEDGRSEDRMLDLGVDRPDTPAHPLRLSRSQEICRKISLTTNIFKKFLRSVRPDRDKLLKERPGWMAPELSESDLFKRPKKLAPKSSKHCFYLPFWANGQQSKGRPFPQRCETDRSHHYQLPQVHQQQFAGVYIDRGQSETGLNKMQPLFDYNTAVWV
ncbi:PAK4-inhibitor INKA2 [Brachionichthys hirsutus]|uniref:PAK4-inhibitor INKA2 n=1 Tax=Brachionichthys hirsutus TaxID=412623 RepID=UPI0036046E51